MTTENNHIPILYGVTVRVNDFSNRKKDLE